jgi:tetratricopeptide (TPR) repeat protein
MITGLGLLLLALAAPSQLPGNGPVHVPDRAPRRLTVPSPSFEQVSQSALQAWNESRDDDAIRLFESALKIRPDWDEGLWYLGAAYYQKERFREARELLRHYLGQNPEQGPGWALVGFCDYRLHEYDRALDHLQRARKLGLQGRAELLQAVLYDEAVLLNRSGQFGAAAKAIADFYNGFPKEAASLEIPAGLNVLGYQLLPDEVPSERHDFVRRMGAAVLRARSSKRGEDAKKTLRELVQEHPNEKGAHYQYGALLLEEGSTEGVDEMKKVLAISPSHMKARLELVRYYLSRSELDQARPYVDEALELDSSHPIAHLLKGQLLSASGDAAGAMRQFEDARKLAPDDSRVLWALHRAYTAAGRREEADRIKAEIEKTTPAASK